MTEKIKFKLTLRYDGKQADNHTMDAKQIGQAIVAMSDAVTAISKLIYDDERLVDVDLVETQEGCFGALFEFSSNSEHLFNVLTILGFTGAAGAVKGALEGIKKVGYSPLKYVSSDENSTTLESNGQHFTFDKDTAKALQDATVRKAFSAIIHEPILTQEADSVTFGEPVEGENAQTLLNSKTISSAESLRFKKPNQIVEQVPKKDTNTVELRFTKISFESKTGWKVKLLDGKEYSRVKIEDTTFFQKVQENKQEFSSDQIFSCKLRIESPKSIGGTDKYFIEEVLRHRVAKDKKIIEDK